MRHALDGGRAGADYGDALVAELMQIPVGITAGVSVIPAAGVEGMPLEGVDALNAGELGPVKRPVGHDDESGADAVAAIGSDDPAALFLAPGERFDLRLEACVAVQVEMLADTPRVRQDFRRVGVLLPGYVADLLEQRKVDVRLDIA